MQEGVSNVGHPLFIFYLCITIYSFMKRMQRIVGLLFLLIVSGSSLMAQNRPSPLVPVDSASNKIMYREVVKEQGEPGYLYDRAIQWFRSYYADPMSVYNVQDRASGKIEGTGRMRIYYFDDQGTRIDGGQVIYSIKMELKENRYRYSITDFTLRAASRFPLEKWLNKSDPAYNPNWDGYLYQVDTTMQRLITTLKAGMKPPATKTDEW